MERLGSVAAFACGVTLIVMGLAVGEAGAKGPIGSGEEEAMAGITVTGIGFGPRDGVATERAFADARRRARAVASALGVAAGAPEAIETPALTQFGDPRPCRDRGRLPDAPDCARTTRAAAAVVTFAIAGGSGVAGGRDVDAEGVAAARVEPSDRDSSRSIKRALSTARREATPRAVADAARRARLAARASPLRLGPLVSVSEAQSPYYYGATFYETALGTFGPGRFCGIVRRPVLRRDPDTGAVRVVRRVARRSCYSPTSYSLRFAVSYEASGSRRREARARSVSICASVRRRTRRQTWR
jgi:hypothetical protein